MSRPYSDRPLTPGVVTIWYRPPELLLETKNYTPAIDLWSAGLIVGELLLNEPVLMGDTALEQLSLIVKLIGSPEKEDIAALNEIGCPSLIRWQREAMSLGRPDNLDRKFRDISSEGTVRFLAGLLTWDPKERWTATEALGKGKSRKSDDAASWWHEKPRPVEKEMLPTFPELRNRADEKSKKPLELREARKHANDGVKEEFGGYSFDFGDDDGVVKGPKRRRRER